ncbi:MAG: hypothetical protein ACO4AV_09120 [bacterium]
MNVNTQIAAGSKNTKRAFVFRCVLISRSCDGSRAVLDPKDCQAWKVPHLTARKDLLVAYRRLIVAQLLISTQAVSDLLPGLGGVVQRLLGRDLSTHGCREVFVQDIPVLEGAWNP